MWTRLGKAVLTAIVVVITAEMMARAVMGRITFAHSYDEPRNPNFRRAWPAFTEPRPRGPEEKLVILISNSQGYAPELEDGTQCYAHQIQVQLNEYDPEHHYTVANWSIAGASGPEILLLTARAIDHDPDLLMIVTHSNPFSFARANMKLSFIISDSNQLAYIRSVRDRLPDWVRREQRELSPALFLESHSGLIRLRDVFVEQREGRWVPRQLNPSRRMSPYRRRLPRAPKVRQGGEKMFNAVVHTFREGRPDTPVLVVSMPLCQSKWDPQSWPGLHGFGHRMQEMLAEGFPGDPKITLVDAIDAIDPTLFITQAHMTPRGHTEFSQYLLPHVRASLDGPLAKRLPGS